MWLQPAPPVHLRDPVAAREPQARIPLCSPRCDRERQDEIVVRILFGEAVDGREPLSERALRELVRLATWAE
jgi:hypothetical protein